MLYAIDAFDTDDTTLRHDATIIDYFRYAADYFDAFRFSFYIIDIAAITSC